IPDHRETAREAGTDLRQLRRRRLAPLHVGSAPPLAHYTYKLLQQSNHVPPMVPDTLDMSTPEAILSVDALHELVYETQGPVFTINPKRVIAVMGLTADEIPMNQLMCVCAEIFATSTSINIAAILQPSMAVSVPPDDRGDLQPRALLKAAVDHLWAADGTTHGGLKRVGDFLVFPGAFPPISGTATTATQKNPPPLPPRPPSSSHVPVDLTDPQPKRQKFAGPELSDAGENTHGRADMSAAGAASAGEEEDSDEERLLTRIHPRRQDQPGLIAFLAERSRRTNAVHTYFCTDQTDIQGNRASAHSECMIQDPSANQIQEGWESGEPPQAPGQAPIYNEKDFVPGHLSTAVPFWKEVILKDHMQPDLLLSWINGVDIHTFVDKSTTGSF
ncbi:unnamed protein product, partial [Sphacelaria rigidula]